MHMETLPKEINVRQFLLLGFAINSCQLHIASQFPINWTFWVVRGDINMAPFRGAPPVCDGQKIGLFVLISN